MEQDIISRTQRVLSSSPCIIQSHHPFPSSCRTTSRVLVRHYSFDPAESPFPTVTKKDLERYINENKKDYTLVDVRSLLEVEQTGKINTAHVIPLPEIEAALRLSDAEFEQKFGTPKFKKSDKVIFYCQSGKRSEQACLAAKAAGMTNVQNYRGSAKEWFNL